LKEHYKQKQMNNIKVDIVYKTVQFNKGMSLQHIINTLMKVDKKNIQKYVIVEENAPLLQQDNTKQGWQNNPFDK